MLRCRSQKKKQIKDLSGAASGPLSGGAVLSIKHISTRNEFERQMDLLDLVDGRRSTWIVRRQNYLINKEGSVRHMAQTQYR